MDDFPRKNADGSRISPKSTIKKRGILQPALVDFGDQTTKPAGLRSSIRGTGMGSIPGCPFQKAGSSLEKAGRFSKNRGTPKSSGINQHNYGLMGFSGIFHHGLWFITKLVYNSNNYGLMAFSGINQHFWEPP